MHRVVSKPRLAAEALLASFLLVSYGGIPVARAESVSIVEASYEIRANILGHVPGLDARLANFFILRDVSGSIVDLHPIVTHIIEDMIKHFFCDGDSVTLIPFARQPLSCQTYPYRTGTDANVLLGALTVPVDISTRGTDILQPVLNATEYSEQKMMWNSSSHLCVIVRFTDTAESDIYGTRGSKYVSSDRRKLAEYRRLLSRFTNQPDDRIRQHSFGPYQFAEDEIGDPSKRLYVTLWARPNYEQVDPTEGINRDRQKGDVGFAGLSGMSYDADKHAVLLTWRKLSPKRGQTRAYRIFLGNSEQLIYKALGGQVSPEEPGMLVLDVDKWSRVSSDEDMLCTSVPISNLRRRGIEAQPGSYIFGAARVVFPGGETDTNDNLRVFRVPPTEGSQPLILLEIVLFVIGVVATLHVLCLPHVITVGPQIVRIALQGRGIPVISGHKWQDGDAQSNAIFVPSSLQTPALEGEGIAQIGPRRWFGLELRPGPGVRATVNGTNDLALRPGEVNRIQMVHTQHNNAIFALEVQMDDFLAKYRGAIFAMIAAWCLNVACSVALAIALALT